MNTYDKAIARLTSDPKVWLITGVAGFIGSNLLEALLRLNQRVVGLDNFATASGSNLNEVRFLVGRELWKNFRFIEGDIRALKTCADATDGVDYVLHQAALGSVPRSVAHPADFHSVNVTGTLNMLLAARDACVARFVFASSSSVYGDSEELPKREDKTGRCLAPYAATKQAGELYTGVFARCYGLETVCLRYFNVFGPRQDPNGMYAAVIPKWVAAMIASKPVFINGDGETSRDFCYVANVVQANLLAATAEPAAINRVYNIAMRDRTTLNQLFELLRACLVAYYPHVRHCQPTLQDFRPADVRHSEADISSAKELLGYQPTHNVTQGIQDALDWYRTHLTPTNNPVLKPTG